MRFIDYYGDKRLRHKIVYEKDAYSECIYCGAKADTREHIPSKVFLVKPYPDNLAIVPACFGCNNSFSYDELFLSILIEKLKYKYYGSQFAYTEETLARLNNNKKLEGEIEKAISRNNINELEERIKRVLFKLAIGHAVYETSEGYCLKNVTVKYAFLNNMSDEEIENFCQPLIIDGQLFPEVGSRAYERIRVLEVKLSSTNDPNKHLTTQVLCLEWVEVQASKYIYTSYRFGDEIVVKLIINDFLYALVIIYVDE